MSNPFERPPNESPPGLPAVELRLERALRESDLITSESFFQEAARVLKEAGIPCVAEEYTKGNMIDAESDTRTPDEYVLSIRDTANPKHPATFEATQTAFQALKDAKIVIRYAKPHGDGAAGRAIGDPP